MNYISYNLSNMDTKLSAGILCVFLFCMNSVLTQNVDTVPRSTCKYHVIADTDFQSCVSILGNLNTTVLTPQDKCSYYAESVFCSMRAVQQKGGQCSLADINYWYNVTVGFIDQTIFNSCNVSAESSSMCSDTDRLSSFALTSCMPYLSQMESTQCMLVDYFLKCAQTYLGYVSVSCTETQLQSSLVSSVAAAWLKSHHFSVDMRSCINASPTTTTTPGMSSACTAVYDMFSNKGITGCLFFLQDANLTGSNAMPQKDGCSLINEALACMQRSMRRSGYTCSLQQMHDGLIGMLHVQEMLGDGVSGFVTNCPVDSYYESSMCTDTYRLSTYLASGIRGIFAAAAKYNSKSLACITIERTALTYTAYINITCTPTDVWYALKSPEGRAKLTLLQPDLDISTCGLDTMTTAASLGVHTDTEVPDTTPATTTRATTTRDPRTSSKCTDVMDMFSNTDVIGCIFFIHEVNLTGSNAIPQKDGCSLINEAVACMQRSMKRSGYTCSLQQMHDTLIGMLHVQEMLGNGVSGFITHCPVDPSYESYPVCTDDYRLVNYLVNTMTAIFNMVEGYHIENLVCGNILTSADNFLAYLNVTCTSAEVWSALKSPDGQAKLTSLAPDLDIAMCGGAGSTTTMAPAANQGDDDGSQVDREEMHAESVADWLLVDKHDRRRVLS